MKFLAIHHSAVKRTSSPQLWAVDRYHREKWGMRSRLGWWVGYNYFIDVDGKTTQTRSWSEEQIAQRGHNCDVPTRCDTISVCLADNYHVSEVVSEAQNASLRDLIRDVKKVYPLIKVVGHRDLQESRTCPGLPEWYIDSYNDIQPNDPVDHEKQTKIKLLQARLDSLRALLNKLLDTFK